jgi:hypothetical protein
MAESFFSALKKERVYRTAYATKAQARRDVIRCPKNFAAAQSSAFAFIVYSWVSFLRYAVRGEFSVAQMYRVVSVSRVSGVAARPLRRFRLLCWFPGRGMRPTR